MIDSIQSTRLTETEVKALMLQILKDHLRYSEAQFHDNSANIPGTGYFGSGECDLRISGDYALMYAFLYSQFPNETFVVSRTQLRDRAIAAIRYATATHVTGTGRCAADGLKWGHEWQSALWSMPLGLAAQWLWTSVPTGIRASFQAGVQAMIEDEADYRATRTPTVREWGNTGAEENAWDTTIFAAAQLMFPTNPNVPTWDRALSSFAMNTASTAADEFNNTVVDGDTVANWVLGPNLHPDYTLDNHGFFHPIYQVYLGQALTESAVFYAMANKPVPGALRHNILNTWNSVLKKMIVADSDWAYPAGSDWDITTYEQLGAFSALATLEKDVDAAFIESRMLQMVRARQEESPDWSFVPDADVGVMRQAIHAHGIVLAYLFHQYFGAPPATTTTWSSFQSRESTTKRFPYARVVTGRSPSTYASFSWSSKFLGNFVPNADGYLLQPYVTFPYKDAPEGDTTGNFSGYFTVSGRSKTPSYQSSTVSMQRDAFVTTGLLAENDAALDHHLSFAKTPGNAVVYLDEVRARGSHTITSERGVPLGIVTDSVAVNSRSLHHASGSVTSDGSTLVSIPGTWVNIDGKLSMVVPSGQALRFGNRARENSVNRSILWGSYSNTQRSVTKNQLVSSRAATVYSNIDATMTAALAADARYPAVGTGWKAAAIKDPDNRRYLVASNFNSLNDTGVTLSYSEGAPVLKGESVVTASSGLTQLSAAPGSAQLEPIHAYVTAGSGTLWAVQGTDPSKVHLRNPGTTAVNATVRIWNGASFAAATQSLAAGEAMLAQLASGAVSFSNSAYPGSYRKVSQQKQVDATSHEPAYLAFNALDEDPSTYWVSLGAPSTSRPQELVVDLQGDYSVDKVVIRSRASYGPKNVSVYVAQDRFGEVHVADALLPNSEGPHTVTFSARTARRVRIRVTSAYDPQTPVRSVQIREVEVHGRLPIANLAPAGTTTATSTAVGSTAPNATDGSATTFWTSGAAPQVTTQYLTSNLGAEFDVSRVSVRSNSGFGPRQVAVEVSLDGAAFTQVLAATLPNGEGPHSLAFPSVPARYCRLAITSAYDTQATTRNVQVKEFEVFGTPVPPRNLALGRVPVASSSEAAFPASSAGDDQLETFWVSLNPPSATTPQTLTYDLVNTHSVSAVEVVSRAGYGPNFIRIEVATTATGGFSPAVIASLSDTEGPHVIAFPTVSARRVRLTVESSYDSQAPSRSVQVREFKVYGR